MKGTDLAAKLEARGFDFFAGVPCSLISGLIAALEDHPRLPYVPAVREDLALGLAGGTWLAGRRPVVIMQNSGLGTALNALASFTVMYGLPALLLVTWRGFQGRDAPEHILMGEISPRLLDLLGIPSRVLSAASADDDLDWAAREMDTRSGPVALLVPPGVVDATHGAVRGTHGAVRGTHGAVRGTHGVVNDSGLRPLDTTSSRATPPGKASASPDAGHLGAALKPTMSRLGALRLVHERLDGRPAVHANGYICRESFSLGDRPQNFYMIGSMGLASAIGLGLALARPAATPVILDGDGNLLMSLGVLAMVASLAPPNFVHCVFDNEAYGSTGHQRSPSSAVRLDRVANAAGYRDAVAVADASALAEALDHALRVEGPHFLLVKVTREEVEVPRIPHSPPAIRDRFRKALLGSA